MKEKYTTLFPCHRVKPGLWAQFIQRRDELDHGPADQDAWTCTAVRAWLALHERGLEPQHIAPFKYSRKGATE